MAAWSLSRRRRGIFTFDVITGLVLLATISFVLLAAQRRSVLAQQKLADERAALRAADRALLALESQTSLPPLPGFLIAVHPLGSPVGDLRLAWVKVQAVGPTKASASLIGLIEQSALPKNTAEGGRP